MTRFLSRIWDDPECGAFNKDTERLFAYHQATKHTYHSVRTNARYLDWHNQPDPFRAYEGVPTIPLPPEPGFPNDWNIRRHGGARGKNKTACRRTRRNAAKQFNSNLTWLSRFLWHSMAVSAWKKVPGSGARYSLRVNPSSGNLHPTETYIALRAFAGMEDGLYHYRADRHALETSEPRRLDAAPCACPRNSLGSGVAADRRTDLHLLARSLEVRRTRLSLLLPRFGPRDDELAFGCARVGNARRRSGPLQRCAPRSRNGSGRKRRSSHGISGLSCAGTLRLDFSSRP